VTARSASPTRATATSSTRPASTRHGERGRV
jgi:hypothetical protein